MTEEIMEATVQLVYEEQDRTASVADVLGELDPATASDAQVLERVAWHWDIPIEGLARHQVARPATGHILCSEKAVYG